MTDFMCRYSGDRDQAIVSYLYDEENVPAERAAFQAHLLSCDRCRTELASLEGVRASLGRWSPPEPMRLTASDQSTATSHRLSSWRDIPAWAQVSAALLVLGVAGGIANLDVRYDANGLRVRTGWSAAARVQTVAPVGNAAPWREELTAFEQRLRSDLSQSASSANPATVVNPGNSVSAEALRRVRSLVEESERRQQRELALRLAEVMHDVDSQRRADLLKIDRSIGAMQSNTGLEMLRQRETINSINNYIVRTSSQRPQ